MAAIVLDGTRWSAQNGGGRYTRELIRGLAARGDGREWTVLTAGPREDMPLPTRALEAREGADWRAQEISLHQWDVPAALYQLKAGLYHGLAYMTPLMWRHSCRTVVTVHDVMFEEHPEWYHPLTRAFYSTWGRASAEGADAVVVPSRYVAERVSAMWGIAADKIVVTPFGIDRATFHPRGKTSWLYGQGLGGAPYFIAGGGVHIRKNLRTVIGAFRRLVHKGSDARLVLFGVDDEALGRADRQALTGLPAEVKARLRWYPYVTDDELAQLYSGAVALLYPTLGEGFGLPAAEAQACGCAVIASQSGSVPEVVVDCGLFVQDPLDEAEVAARAAEVLDAVAAHGRWPRAGMSGESGAPVGWDQCVDATARIYATVLGAE